MIICPKCKENAHLTLMWRDSCNYSDNHIYEYECECGCKFEAIFVLKETKVLEEE